MPQKREKKLEQTVDTEQMSPSELIELIEYHTQQLMRRNGYHIALDPDGDTVNLNLSSQLLTSKQETSNSQDLLKLTQELSKLNAMTQDVLQNFLVENAKLAAAETSSSELAQSILSNVEQLINKTEPEELSKQFGSFLVDEPESDDTESESLLLLELENLKLLYERRQKLLENSLTSTQVAELLGWKNRKTVHDRLKANKIIGIKDKSQVKFPIWQFDPDGDDGILNGLPQLLSALEISNFRKLSWLTKPLQTFEGKTPVNILKQGDRNQVKELIIEAKGVGVLQ